MTRRSVEIESLAEFDARIARTDRLDGWFLQSIDLTDRSDVLARVDPHGAVFLGCRLADQTADRLRDGGALLFPQLPGLPFDPYRPELYRPELLVGRGRYRDGSDAEIYAWAKSGAARSLTGALATALHDQSIADALDEALHPVPADRVVGVMGGHDLRRDDDRYAAAVRLGGMLAAAGRVVLTGGGPGAMEAANLGARLGARIADAEERGAAERDALAVLARAPGYRPDVDAWFESARTVLGQWFDTGSGQRARRVASLGIPTWFYGHEPPNLFPDRIAKYFANPLREDTLLHRCRGGIVVLPGAAGTVQEIFTATTENYYATDAGSVVPLVLVGRAYWTEQFPAWPLLQRLAGERPMAEVVRCVETVEEAVAALTAG